MPRLTIAASLAYVRGPACLGIPMTSRAEVWAIVRFDKDDRKIEVFWSEKTCPGLSIPDSGSWRPYGSHAEPVFIRKYPTMVTEYGKPDLIEVFLSRSPCRDGSEAMQIDNVLYPPGCGPKLRLFARNNPGIKINVIYDVVYVGNPQNPNEETDRESKREIVEMFAMDNLGPFMSRDYPIAAYNVE